MAQQQFQFKNNNKNIATITKELIKEVRNNIL